MAMAFGVLGILAQTAGTVMGFKYEQQQAEMRERVGQVRAADTHSAHTDELNRTISTIKAIRASAGVSADSPSTAAVLATESKRSNSNRNRAVGAEKVASEAAKNDANYFGTLAGLSLLGGVAKAGGYMIGQAS